MSRIGFLTINIPDNVTLSINDNKVIVTGPLGTLNLSIPSNISVEINDKNITVARNNELKPTKSSHGMTRATIANMLNGVTKGWERKLELIGTGYRARMEGDKLHLSIGYSHPVVITPAQGINFSVDGQNFVIVKGFDKQLVGLTASKVRDVRPPEPYKGKGIRYLNELVRRKAGKAAKA